MKVYTSHREYDSCWNWWRGYRLDQLSTASPRGIQRGQGVLPGQTYQQKHLSRKLPLIPIRYLFLLPRIWLTLNPLAYIPIDNIYPEPC